MDHFFPQALLVQVGEGSPISVGVGSPALVLQEQR